MVKEALFQGTEWHMWLYYLPDIVKGMARNYAVVDPQTDINGEWPIIYSYLLYEAFTAMAAWVIAVEEVPANQPNATLKSTRVEHENNNIPKSSILALSECARYVLESAGIDDRLKRYLMNIVFNLYFELRESGNLDGYADVLSAALSHGGFYRRRSDQKYRTSLIHAFEQEKTEYLIKHPDSHVAALEQALRSA